MKVLFLKLSENVLFDKVHPRDIQPNLSICYSMSLLDKDGHETFMIDTELEKIEYDNIIERVNEINPDIIFIDTLCSLINFTLRLSNQIKKNRVICVINQPETVFSNFLFKESPINLCTVGEYEFTIKDIVKGFSKNIMGIAYFDDKIIKTKEREMIENLDELPFPKHEVLLKEDYDIYYPIKLKERVKWGHMMASRGCPYRCIHCSFRISYGNYYRFRTVKNIVDEMFYLKNNGANVINFVDDNFVSSKKRILEFCEEIEKRKLDIKWTIQTRTQFLDFELLNEMKMAGCCTIAFGIESGSDRILKILKKDIDKKEIIKAFQICKKIGILTVGYFMIGNPDENEVDIKETIKFCKKIKPDLIQVHYTTSYPNTRLFNSEMKVEKMSHYHNIPYNLSNIPSRRLQELHKKFYREYFFSLPFLMTFINQKFPYILYNFKKEIEFMFRAIRYLLN